MTNKGKPEEDLDEILEHVKVSAGLIARDKDKYIICDKQSILIPETSNMRYNRKTPCGVEFNKYNKPYCPIRRYELCKEKKDE